MHLPVSRFLRRALLSVLLATSTTPFQTVVKAQSTATTTTIYSVNYVAKYTFLLDYLCSASKAELELTCGNSDDETSTLILEGTDDPDLVCTADPNHSGRMTCINQCEEDCSYITDSITEETYGNVYFRCEGSSVQDTQATFLYVGTQATCSANIYDNVFLASQNRVYHIHQLGVFCADQGPEGDFVIAGQYMECPGQSGRAYQDGFICGQGEDCNFAACTPELNNSTIVSQVDVLQDTACMNVRESSEPVPLASPSPSPPVYPSGKYTTRYQAQWRMREPSGACTTPSPVVTITCLDGTINLIATLYETTECTPISETKLECRETCPTSDCDYYLYDLFRAPDWGQPFDASGAIYECVDASQPPLSQVTYPETTSDCCGELNTCYGWMDDYYIDHSVTLGMYCGSPTAGGDYYYDDNINDCSPYNDDFIKMYTIEGTGPENSAQVVCTAGTVYDIPTEPVPFEIVLPSIQVYSQTHFRDNCFTMTAVSEEEAGDASTTAVTPSPTTVSSLESTLEETQLSSLFQSDVYTENPSETYVPTVSVTTSDTSTGQGGVVFVLSKTDQKDPQTIEFISTLELNANDERPPDDEFTTSGGAGGGRSLRGLLYCGILLLLYVHHAG